MNIKPLLFLLAISISLIACDQTNNSTQNQTSTEPTPKPSKASNPRFNIYAPFTLTADLSHLSENQKKMVGILIDAAKIMEDLFWLQAYGDKDTLLNSIKDPDAKRFAEYNFGPWDRLAANKPFIKGVGPKPDGANFYPADMSIEEFEAADLPGKKGLYSLIQRDDAGKLIVVPYSKAYATQLQKASDLLKEAANYAEDKPFKEYLSLRAQALLNNDYQASDMAWMDIKTNPVELVYGPIENYEDKLFGYRTAFEAFVLIKDLEWSKRLSKFAQFLPLLQEDLPVDDKYKAEMPGSDADLNAYDAVYYAGDSNAGAKTIAINLPNDEEVQLKKGTRRLQLKNAMQAKFDKILVPIADVVIAEDQRKHVTFNAFFANTMFHEVAHGLGIKNTITGKGPVRTALKDVAGTLEEGKADILGLYMITKLHKKGEIKEGTLMDNYVTFMAGIFRSIRFGASSAHGKANMIRFNYFRKMHAFTRDDKTEQYRIDFGQMQKAMSDLSSDILRLQGDGDYEKAKRFIEHYSIVSANLQHDLYRIQQAEIPVDITFRQGKEILGL